MTVNPVEPIATPITTAGIAMLRHSIRYDVGLPHGRYMYRGNPWEVEEWWVRGLTAGLKPPSNPSGGGGFLGQRVHVGDLENALGPGDTIASVFGQNPTIMHGGQKYTALKSSVDASIASMLSDNLPSYVLSERLTIQLDWEGRAPHEDLHGAFWQTQGTSVFPEETGIYTGCITALTRAVAYRMRQLWDVPVVHYGLWMTPRTGSPSNWSIRRGQPGAATSLTQEWVRDQWWPYFNFIHAHGHFNPAQAAISSIDNFREVHRVWAEAELARLEADAPGKAHSFSIWLQFVNMDYLRAAFEGYAQAGVRDIWLSSADDVLVPHAGSLGFSSMSHYAAAVSEMFQEIFIDPFEVPDTSQPCDGTVLKIKCANPVHKPPLEIVLGENELALVLLGNRTIVVSGGGPTLDPDPGGGTGGTLEPYNPGGGGSTLDPDPGGGGGSGTLQPFDPGSGGGGSPGGPGTLQPFDPGGGGGTGGTGTLQPFDPGGGGGGTPTGPGTLQPFDPGGGGGTGGPGTPSLGGISTDGDGNGAIIIGPSNNT